MPEQDDRLDEALREYYRRAAQQPAPDVTRRVMMTAGPRGRRLGAPIGGGALAAAGAAVVVVVALANHHPAGVGSPAHSSTPAPSATAAPASASPSPSAAPVAGPPVHGFAPVDVTAISATQWWVLGQDGAQCTSESCVRILHTTDGGRTFNSIPVPPIGSGDRAIQLRFADASDGWAVSSTGPLWATHDGGASWTYVAAAQRVVEVEASGGSVYAITCATSICALERSPVDHDAWASLAGSLGARDLRNLLVNGSRLWVVDGSQDATALLASGDGGQSFVTENVCPGDLGISSVYAVDGSVLWATCATGTQAAVLLSTDSGQHFASLGDPGIVNSAPIAGVSSSVAIAGSGTELVRSTDGGRSFATVATATSWTSVAFTTSSNGFAFDLGANGVSTLWRTNDAGSSWYRLQFP